MLKPLDLSSPYLSPCTCSNSGQDDISIFRQHASVGRAELVCTTHVALLLETDSIIGTLDALHHTTKRAIEGFVML